MYVLYTKYVDRVDLLSAYTANQFSLYSYGSCGLPLVAALLQLATIQSCPLVTCVHPSHRLSMPQLYFLFQGLSIRYHTWCVHAVHFYLPLPSDQSFYRLIAGFGMGVADCEVGQ